MKILCAQPATLRFSWELEVLLTNLMQHSQHEVILLFTENDPSVPRYLAEKYGARCYVYKDTRFDKAYIPSVRPWLWWQFLKEDPSRSQETYFYIDSDVIFRQWPRLERFQPTPTTWYGSDCSSYLDYDYIASRRNGSDILRHMGYITDLNPDAFKGVPGIGAHLFIANPTAAFWEKAYNDSNAIWHYFETVSSDIQKWTAEMWAQLWGMVREGITPVIDSELDFCMATDTLQRYEQVNIMHNAGVLVGQNMFFKGQYVQCTPFGKDLDSLDHDKASWRYVQAIQKVKI